MERDARIPVMFGQQVEPGDAVLLEEGQAAPAGVVVGRFAAGMPGHLPGCACCGRSPAAAALAAAYRARATGSAPYFSRLLVVASGTGAAAVAAALAGDALVRARFRAAGDTEK